jgi:hypothetical protein
MGVFGNCEECKQPNTYFEWCNSCNARRFQQNFKNWTSGNDDIDKLIQGTQLTAINYMEVLEWIPYNRFYDIEYIARGGFGEVYKAKWIDGILLRWNNKNWERYNSNEFVALKCLNNSENVTSKFFDEVYFICYLMKIVRFDFFTNVFYFKNIYI